jgi:hypothetical protein
VKSLRTELTARFNDLLARAYVLGEHESIKDLLRTNGFSLPARGRKKTAPEPRDSTRDPHNISGD